MAAIHLLNVEKRFGDQIALFPSSLEIRDGEFVVLVGPSGCGKTTFLRLIAGLEDVSDGSIKIGERDVTWVEPKNRGVAMVFQNYALYPHLTVEKNLQYPLNILKLSKQEKRQRIQEVSKILEIDTLLNRKPAQLSGGQQQRVAIGRALVRRPKIFLFDEPLSNLDARLREQMRLEIADLHTQLKRTTVYVTHDQREAMTLGDRLVVMKDGRIMQQGNPTDLYTNPSSLFVAQFLGSPPMNTFSTTMEDNAVTGEFGRLQPPGMPEMPETEITMGIRPEAISTSTGKTPSAEFKGEIDFIEHLGREVHLRVKIGREEIWAVSEPGTFSVNQQVSLFVPWESIFWFSTKTGERINW